MANESLNCKNHYIHLVIAIAVSQEYQLGESITGTGITIVIENINIIFQYSFEILKVNQCGKNNHYLMDCRQVKSCSKSLD